MKTNNLNKHKISQNVVYATFTKYAHLADRECRMSTFNNRTKSQ